MKTVDEQDLQTLEEDYDRPSLHSMDPTDRTIGRVTAIMEQHAATFHAQIFGTLGPPVWRTFEWHDHCCALCGFDSRGELFRLYPEYLDQQITADREQLEADYDLPGLHSEKPVTLVVARMGAIQDRHRNHSHPRAFRCSEACGFDIKAELRRLYPEYEE